MKELHPKVVWRDIDTIRPYRLNSKTHPPGQVDRIADSIKAYGFDVPIVLDSNGEIIKGEGRYLASQKLGLQQVPTIIRDDLTPTQVRAARIADNRAALSDFDLDALSIELPSLTSEGIGLPDLGFSQQEFDDIMTLCVPGSMDDIDSAAEKSEKPDSDETSDWEKISLKVPPETKQVFDDLLNKTLGRPHEQLDAMLSAVDVLALEAVSRMQKQG